MAIGGVGALSTFEAQWTGIDGAVGREAIRAVWSDFPRAADSYAAGFELGGCKAPQAVGAAADAAVTT